MLRTILGGVKMESDNKKIKFRIGMIMILVGVLLLLFVGKLYYHDYKINSNVTSEVVQVTNSNVDIPNTNLTCNNPEVKNESYYCNIENITSR